MYKIFWLVFGLCACNNPSAKEQKIQAFAQELPLALVSKKNLAVFMDKPSLPRIEQLSHYYHKLYQSWKNIPDKQGNDHFKIIKGSLSKDKMQGDCEDFSASLLSIALALGFHSQLILANNTHSGHVWLEVRISLTKPSSQTLAILEKYFKDSVNYTQRNDGYWLQFAPKGSLKHYQTSHSITPKGEVTKHSQHAIIP